MTANKNRQSRIVADGIDRVRKGSRLDVEKSVQAEYASALTIAGFFGRLWIKLKIRREISRKLDRLAPKGALYIKP